MINSLGCEMGVPPFLETPTSSNGYYLLFWGCSSFLGFGESSHQSMEFNFFPNPLLPKFWVITGRSNHQMVGGLCLARKKADVNVVLLLVVSNNFCSGLRMLFLCPLITFFPWNQVKPIQICKKIMSNSQIRRPNLGQVVAGLPK